MLDRFWTCAVQCAAFAGASLLIVSSAANAAPRIVNGLTTHDFPTTGALLRGAGAVPIDGDNAVIHCSGTLIGCRTFLTAAHCVADDLDPSHYWVYLHHAGILPVSAVIYHPSYLPSASGRDVAIVHLAADVTGIQPSAINATHDLVAIGAGLPGAIVGFGQTYFNLRDFGIKRYGAVQTASCNTALTGGEGDDKLVCWSFAIPVGPPGEDSTTCHGDSGGPIFLTFGSATEVAGVTSAGSSAQCLPFDHSWDASVYYNAAWIEGEIGSDSTATCGGIGPVGDPSVGVVAYTGTLWSGHPSDTFTLDLTGNPGALRVALNGQNSGTFNPDVYVKQGLGAGPTSYDCKADGISAFGSCVFSYPAPGTWSVFVAATYGGGEYQITSTVFAGPPPLCGNDVRESTEQCDGIDLGSCPIGPCQLDCTCPAPVCDNNVMESGEECDGTDAAACTTVCAADCTCAPVCTTGDLNSLKIVSTATRFLYKAELLDPSASYAGLDPRNGFALDVTDRTAAVTVSIAPNDPGWSKSNPAKRKFVWKGDGSNGGLRTVKALYKEPRSGSSWKLMVKGSDVPNAGAIDAGQTLDFTLIIDGMCMLGTL